MTYGLPGSGKSTWAKKEVEKHPGKIKRVNKDDLRAMMDRSWNNENESFTLKIRDFIVNSALDNGLDVIVDDTNLAPKHEKTLRAIAMKRGAEFSIKDFTGVPLKECIRRDLNRLNSVGKDTIMQMYKQHLAPQLARYTPPVGKPKAIIVDIDGTLAHMNGRSPYDESLISTDTVDEPIKSLVDLKRSQGTTIIILSGRHDSCRFETIDWLNTNGVEHDLIFMRPATDDRNDAIIKKELFDKHIRNNFQVEFVLDDRDRVVDMWRTGDLKVLQVAAGDF